ncbi:hypothetical protein PIB30_036636 [Stylosanthes scabra]|uniref:Protein kinase domain-containing protein n=1 Tax=Stylosanthes scabra TaxID=79078 RepID=A0ABU6TD75_9FABA|nr:hypothetical protein [Stylosanthes scabra]
MSCFSCFVSRSKDASRVEIDTGSRSVSSGSVGGKCVPAATESERRKKEEGKGKSTSNGKNSTAAASFGFRELAAATRGFNEVNLIGEGGFGRVYKGRLSTGQATTSLT